MIHFDILKLENELSNLEKQITNSSFWDDVSNSSKVLKRINELKSKVNSYKSVENELHNLEDLNNLLKEESEPELEKELNKSVSTVQNKIGGRGSHDSWRQLIIGNGGGALRFTASPPTCALVASSRLQSRSLRS